MHSRFIIQTSLRGEGNKAALQMLLMGRKENPQELTSHLERRPRFGHPPQRRAAGLLRVTVNTYTGVLLNY